MNQKCSTVQNALLGLFRHALNTEDHVHEFLMLYFIPYDIHEKQAAVDSFILKVEPGTPQSFNKKMKTQETLYTKLRNQLAHKTAVPLEETRAEIASNLDNFRRIVQRALKATL